MSRRSLESVRQKITRWGTRPEGHVVGSTSPLDAIDLTADAHSVRASAMIGATGSTTTTIFEELDELYHKLEVKGKEVAIIEAVGAPLTQSIWALAPDELVRHLG